MAKTLFTQVRVLDGSGADPFDGEVLVDREPEVKLYTETRQVVRFPVRPEHCVDSP